MNMIRNFLVCVLCMIAGGDFVTHAENSVKQDAGHPVVGTSENILPQKVDVLKVIYKVNDYWQINNPAHGNAFWHRAAYHTGNIAAYEVTKDLGYLDFSYAWAERNNWKGATSDRKSEWKYSYGESMDYVLFGDWQVCFQVYADLYQIEPSAHKIARAREVMEYQMSLPASDFWWWADGLYMVMPVMTRLHKITGNALYLEKLHEYWQWANGIMYDEEEGLYYRDARYVYPQWKTSNDKKDFWARGNGWVFAAFARVLADLPETDPYRDNYIQYYTRMAEALATTQQEGGYWTRSIIDPEYVPGEETSGTAFFTYGFLWGINNGYLSGEDYGPVVEKAWDYLSNTALQESGRVGYVQPIGAAAIPGQKIDANSTADFGVGAFLLAASEMYKYVDGDDTQTILRLSSVQAESPNSIVVVFNDTLNSMSAENINNYQINGEPIVGEADFDGLRTVLITLSNPLDYGLHTISVSGLVSKGGVEIQQDSDKQFMLAVPLDAPQEGITVTAIGNQTGNTPQNTMDGSLNTRWSQQGATGQWIKYDLGAKKLVSAVDIAFYNGDKRTAYFSIEVSVDNRIFKPVLQNIISSGITNELERYAFSAEEARYVRIVCNGTSEGDWNSITEVRIRYEDLFNSIPIIEDESEKSSNHSSFYIFPNPCEAFGDIYLAGLKISGGLVDVEIIDLRGVVVASKLNQTVPVHLTTITQAGVYLVKITDEKHRQELLKLTVR